MRRFDRGDMDEEMCELYVCLNYIEAACPCAPGSLPAARPAAPHDVLTT